MEVKVVPFRYAHLVLINLRGVDQGDSKNRDWLAINSNLTVTMMVEDQPITIVGVIKDATGWGYLWLVGSEDMVKYKKGVVKHLKSLKKVIGLRNDLWCLCRFGWTAASDLLLLLDFSPTTIIYTINDINYQVWVWAKHGDVERKLSILRNKDLSNLRMTEA